MTPSQIIFGGAIIFIVLAALVEWLVIWSGGRKP